ncbi:hypothetical protein DV872_20255 [Oceanispirochaeta sp. M1]|nr:hypothetical protein DV872_20255 [Oceanispirochaeta sp. M1]
MEAHKNIRKSGKTAYPFLILLRAILQSFGLTDDNNRPLSCGLISEISKRNDSFFLYPQGTDYGNIICVWNEMVFKISVESITGKANRG